MDQEQKTNAADLFKVIFAIGIMGIHTRVLNVFPETIKYYVMQIYFRLGVPFFFVASGYFFGTKLIKCTCRTERINSGVLFCKRMVIPFCVWGGAAYYGN